MIIKKNKIPLGEGTLYAAQTVCVGFHSSPGEGACDPIYQRPCSVTFNDMLETVKHASKK
jgi:hypothetical protein